MVAVGPSWDEQVAPHGWLCDRAGRHGVAQPPPPASLCFPKPGQSSIPAASGLGCRGEADQDIGCHI